MAERMTWEEIKKAYPDKWVGLTKIEWKDGANVKSAVVDYLGDKVDEAFKRQVAGEDVETIYTGDGSDLCPLGAFMTSLFNIEADKLHVLCSDGEISEFK